MAVGHGTETGNGNSACFIIRIVVLTTQTPTMYLPTRQVDREDRNLQERWEVCVESWLAWIHNRWSYPLIKYQGSFRMFPGVEPRVAPQPKLLRINVRKAASTGCQKCPYMVDTYLQALSLILCYFRPAGLPKTSWYTRNRRRVQNLKFTRKPSQWRVAAYPRHDRG